MTNATAHCGAVLLDFSMSVRFSAAVGIQQLFANTAAPFDQKRTLLRNLDAGLKSLCDAPTGTRFVG